MHAGMVTVERRDQRDTVCSIEEDQLNSVKKMADAGCERRLENDL